MLPSMRKAITLTLSIALLGIFAAVVVAAVGPSDGTSTLPTETDRTGTTPDNTAIDISGPCDEAEHANDPRCAGVQAPTATAPAEDISGPCDEAEHANDPRCTGVGVGDDDSSGPGNGGDIDEDDSSGPGPGGDDDFDDDGGDDFDDDSSGSGHGDDDDFDDHGGDDFDDDSSGSGHGGGGSPGTG
jgi:hypothetical protein